MNDATLTCQDEQRREAVRTDRLNGLDYLEVGDDQKTLTVYFLDKAPEVIEKENVRIEGGRRVRNIQVVDLRVHREEDAALDDWMEVVVDRPGDFSAYTLRVVELHGGRPTNRRMSGFDPRYSRLEFGFKSGCSSDLDCKPQTYDLPVERVEPEIDYLAKDYASFRRLILDRLSLIMPDWRERHVPDLGIAAVEILAYVGDHLSYHQDAVATEAYLETARQRISVRRHASLVDYRMHEGCNARAWVCVTTATDELLDPHNIYFITGYDDPLANGRRVLTPDDLRNVPSSHYEVFEPLVEEHISFRPGKLKDPAGLADKLRRPPDHLALLSQYLQEQFSENTQRLLEGHHEHDSPLEVLRLALIDELNRLLEDDALYHEQRFAQVALAEETKDRIEHRLQGKDGRLNRSLLGDAYPDEIAKGYEIQLYQAHNEICFYTWGDEECYLPRGATTATLRDEWTEPEGESSYQAPRDQTAQQPREDQRYQGPEGEAPASGPRERGRKLHFQAGDVLIFEEVKGPGTGNPADADPAHRHAVRLTRVEPGKDPLFKDPLFKELPTPIVEIEWAPEDALPFPLCLSTIGPAPACELIENVSVVRGNVILVDHGKTTDELEVLGTVPEEATVVRCEDECHPAETAVIPGKFWPRLKLGPLTFSQPLPANGPASGLLKQDPREAVPQITELIGTPAAPDGVVPSWTARYDLLASQGQDHHFVAEIDEKGQARLRFGDGELGQMPEAGAEFRAKYRVGNGPSGDVGAEAITHVVFRRDPVSGLEPRNPLPAQGGTSPEPLAEAKMFAPHAFRAELQRAITADDYARLAERHPKVQRAGATLLWTGSWYEVLVAIDPWGEVESDERLLEEIEEHLYPYRRIGHDLVVAQARYVPLDIELEVCVRPDFLRGHVKAALLDLFGNHALPGGRRGFFHPDNLTFADGIFLSQLVAAAQAVPGVESVTVTKLNRLFEEPNREIENGVLPLGPLEIARLDNDPNLPENGVLQLEMRGGR